jgi:hypothetical protein
MAVSTYVNNIGNTIVQTDVVSSTLTTTDLAIFQTTGSGMVITECIVRTDATGLAGGTNLVLKADGIVFFSTAVSGLGASSVKDIKNASVTGSKVSIPDGVKNITIATTVANGTGAGVANVTLVCQNVISNATIRPL